MVRILIADDTLFMRKMLQTFLVDDGHEIIAEAEDGQQAIHYFLKERPDLTLLDIIMPKMDGIMTLKTIRGVDPSARIIMVSSVQAPEMVKLAIRNGAMGYIMKPFQRHILIKEINRVIAL